MSGPDDGLRGGSASGGDPFEHDDAAYVLGALDDSGRTAFEVHLAGCAACTARVAALQRVTGALASAGDDARHALTPLPAMDPSIAGREISIADAARGPDRVAELARQVERRRRRSRWVVGGFGTVAAAAVAALIVVLVAPSASPSTDARRMTATGAAAISATAAITATPWGSEVTIDCSYTGGPRYAPGDVYTLEVVDRAGRSRQLGSWTLAKNSQARFTSGTALPPGQIREVKVVASDGTVILRLSA